MKRSAYSFTVHQFLHKRPRVLLQAKATQEDQLAWITAHAFWDAGFPENAEKTAGYGQWSKQGKGA